VKGIIDWFARNGVAANLLMVLIIAGGLVALPQIQQKSFPDINIEVVMITVPYLGAAPEEVEQGVCIRIEEEIQGINGIEKLSSTAAEGACTVGAELMSGYPIDRALSEIKNAVDGISTFPVETEKPIINHYAIKRTALQLALSGPADERTLKLLGERLRDDISALPGVTQVELANARSDEISIEVPEASLRRHGLSFDQVVAAVRRSSLDLPGGAIKTADGEILLRTKGQAYRGGEFERIVVLTRPDGTRLTLGEVASVRDGFEEEDRFARFDGEPAVLITVYRVGDQRVIELVETVKAYVDEARATLPEGISLTVWSDGSRSLRDRLDILVRNGMNGFVLVFVLLSCFLRLRLAGWVSIGIPISFLGALALFPGLGISIDVISLFAFILVLGLLVDDAIVIGENVHTHQEAHEDPLQAAITGTQEVSVPVIFGVLTTVAAFLPLLLAPGPMGQIFAGIGLVVILCLLFSLVESQLVLPTHLGHVRIEKDEVVRGGIAGGWKRLQDRMSGSLTNLAHRRYRPALDLALRWRYTTVSIGVVLLAVTVAVVQTGRIRYSFFTAVESDYVTATLTMPDGTPAHVTAEAVEALEAAALRVRTQLDQEFPPNEGRGSLVRHVMSSVGEQPSTGGHTGRGGKPPAGTHLGEVNVELLSGDARPIEARQVVARWREETPSIPSAESLVYSSALFSAGDPINLRLQSADVDSLVAAADELKARLEEYPGVFDVRDSFSSGKRELRLSILPSAEVLGLTLDDLGRQVRQAFYGEEAQRIQRDRQDVRVMVRYPQSQRRSLGDLESMRIRTPDGSEVPFSTVARVEPGRGYSAIRRTDRQRVVNVSADVDLDEANANEIMRDLRASFLPQLLADHGGLRFSVEGEQREQQRVMVGMARAALLALLLIYALLAVPLRSYLQPFIIMSVIPFGLVGAIGGHVLMGQSLSMMSVLGVIALSGVVVNASLVMVHYVNGRRTAGSPLAEAVRDAGVARFRPIVLTSLTTFAGLTPLLLERTVSAQFLIPMAISLAFGVAFATLITLFLVPSLYLILEDAKALLRGEGGEGGEGGSAEVAKMRLRASGDPDEIRNAG
jgi:multidrug efflux pump subunit AcrB